MLARVGMDQGGSVAHARPAIHATLEGDLSPARLRRARIWSPKARMGNAASAGSSNRAGAAARRPDDFGSAGDRTGRDKGDSARGVDPYDGNVHYPSLPSDDLLS